MRDEPVTCKTCEHYRLRDGCVSETSYCDKGKPLVPCEEYSSLCQTCESYRVHGKAPGTYHTYCAKGLELDRECEEYSREPGSDDRKGEGDEQA